MKKHLPLILAGLCGVAVMSGCDRRTPDERLATAIQFYQQGDVASAEMEALKAVEKAPEDPVAVQASILLAQIYTSQNRLEEAEMRLKSALEHVSQRDPMGKEVLRQYLGVLNNQKKFDEALKTINTYQTEYADDPGTSLSLEVAKADVQTIAGETTAARAVLSSIIDATTAPAELALYRELYAKTYMRDEDTTGAANFLRAELQNISERSDKITLLTNLADLEASNGNYELSRQYLQEVTSLFMEEVDDEKDLLNRTARALQLGQVYLTTGNVPGARQVFQTLYDSGVDHPDAVQAIVNHLMEAQLRLGETSATESLLTDAGKKFPQGPYNTVLERMRQAVASGELDKMAPVDTSTLTMHYKEDSLLWPENLPSILAEVSSTTATVQIAQGTTATQTAETTGATVSTPAPVEAATTTPAPVAEPAPAGETSATEENAPAPEPNEPVQPDPVAPAEPATAERPTTATDATPGATSNQ